MSDTDEQCSVSSFASGIIETLINHPEKNLDPLFLNMMQVSVNNLEFTVELDKRIISGQKDHIRRLQDQIIQMKNNFKDKGTWR